ncbi:MAG: thioredoxin [Rhodoferax sp.]|nr:MAG: thioredoxin [Rhodoferax sp.]
MDSTPKHIARPMPDTAPETPALVACLCAQWCLTCGSYRTVFDALAAEIPQVRFVWVDIEDEADLVDPIEVENFPTLLIGMGSDVRFFGTVMPHADTLKRMVQAQLAPENRGTVTDTDVQTLLQRLQARA